MKVPEHRLKLERWQGPPHTNKMKQLFSLFAHEDKERLFVSLTTSPSYRVPHLSCCCWITHTWLRPGHMSVTWFGFGEASSHDGPRIEGRPGSEGGRGGEREVREARSDPRAGLLGREVTVTQKRVCENLQVQAGHGTPQLLHIICVDRRGDIIRITRIRPDLWFYKCKKSDRHVFVCCCSGSFKDALESLKMLESSVFYSQLFYNQQNIWPLFFFYLSQKVSDAPLKCGLDNQDKPDYVFCVCLYDMLVLVKRKQLC